MFDQITVTKGATLSFDLVDLVKQFPLQNIELTVQWGNNSHKNADADLVAVLLRGEDARPKAVTDLVYYNNPAQQGIDLKDARTAGDTEKMKISLNDLPSDVGAVAIYAVVYSVQNPGMTFGHFENPALLIINSDTNEITHQLDLQSAPGSDTFHVGTFYYQNDMWKFKTSGENNALGSKAMIMIGNEHAKNSFKP